MSNVLTGKVVITAPGVQQTMAGVGAAVNKAQVALKQMPATTSAATQSLVNLSRVAQDAPYGFIGIANNLNPLLESFQRLKVETGSTKGALKSLGQSLTGAGGIGLALGIASSLLVVFGDKLFGAGKQAEKAKTAADALRDSISGVFKEVAKEAVEVGSLVSILKSETETRERRLSAIKELQRIQPEIFNGLKLEGDAVVGLDAAYTNYLANLKNVIAAKIIQARLEQKIEQLLRLQGAAATESEKQLQQATKNIRAFLSKPLAGGEVNPLKEVYANMDRQSKKTVDTIQSDIDGLLKDLGQFSSAIKLPDVKPATALKIKTDVEVEVLDLSFLNVNIDDNAFKDKNVFKTLFGEKAKEFGFESIKIPVKYSLFLKKGGEVTNENISGEAVEEIDKAAVAISESIANLAAESIGSLAEGLGTALATGDLSKGFKAFADVIANGFIGIGKQMIAAAPIIETLKAAIKTLNPAVLLPAGIALVAIGAALKASTSGIRGARADGGPVVGGQSYLVGERGPEVFTPNTGGGITANHHLGGRGNVSGSGMMGGQVVFKIAGKELIGVLSLAQQSQNRLV